MGQWSQALKQLMDATWCAGMYPTSIRPLILFPFIRSAYSVTFCTFCSVLHIQAALGWALSRTVNSGMRSLLRDVPGGLSAAPPFLLFLLRYLRTGFKPRLSSGVFSGNGITVISAPFPRFIPGLRFIPGMRLKAPGALFRV